MADTVLTGESVHTCPANIESCSDFGHFELDTIEAGRNSTD